MDGPVVSPVAERARSFLRARFRLALGEAMALVVVTTTLWVGLYRGNLATLVSLPAWSAVALYYLPIVGGFLGAGWMMAKGRGERWRPSPAHLLLLYGLVAALATLWVLDGYAEGSYYALSFLAACAFVAATARGPAGGDRLRFVFAVNLGFAVALTAAFLFASLASGAIFAYLSGLAGRLYGSRPADVGLLWATANGVGRFAAITALLAVVAWSRGERRTRAYAGAAFAFSLLLLLVTVSRSSWIGFGASLLVTVWLLLPPRRVLVGASLVALLIAATGALTGIASYLARGQSWRQLATFSNRSGTWADAMARFDGSPLIGFGFQADRLLLGEHLHNAWLQALFQGGFVGFAMFLAAWMWGWSSLVRLGLRGRFANHRGPMRTELVVATAVLVLLTVRSLVESTGAFFGVDLLLLAPLLAGLAVASARAHAVDSAALATGTMGRRKVLMGAYAFAPPDARTRSGEEILGWSLAHQVARRYEVWVLASGEHEHEARAALGASPWLHVVFVDLPRALRWMRRRQGFVQLYAYAWQARALFTAWRLHRRHRFDLYHHVTYANDWMASHIGALLPIPFVRGPGGGAHRVPPPFRAGRGLRFRMVQGIRTLAQRTFRLDPFFLLGQARAKALLVCNEEARRSVPTPWQPKTQPFPVNGIEVAEAPGTAERPSSDGFVVLTAARLVPIKGLDLAMRAFAPLARADPRATFRIVGEGPEEASLRALAERLGIAAQIRWDGWRTRSEVLARMAEADAFLFPSLRDGGGAVVVEAMSQGLPVVCLDLGGPGTHVRDEWGIKVPALDPDQAVRDLAAALLRLHNAPDLRRRLGDSARRRATAEYAWERLGERLHLVYEDALRPIRSGLAVGEGVPG